MGIINDQVKHAFDNFKKDGDLQKFVMKLVYDANSSVRYAWQFAEVQDALRKHCPKPVFECVYYDGEHGEYRLFDFDPNGLSSESIQIKVRGHLQRKIGVELDYIDKAMESVYLIDTNAMIKVVTK